jgi:mediator of RNA polymerase II transcription subunit 12
MDRFRILQRQRRFVPQLAAVLLMLAAHGRLPSAAQEEVRAATDQHRCKSPPMPAFEVDIEQSMKALTQIIHAGAAERATVLAPKLFTRHGKFENWAEVWWTTVVKAVHTAETAKSANAVAAAVAHVGQVDNQAGDGTLRPVGAKWVEGLTASQRVDIFGRRHVPPIVSLLLSLIIQRRLGSFVLLEKLVFPELKHAAGLCTAPNARLSSKRTCAIDWTVALTQRLLLCTGHKSLPPQNLREAFVVQTARAAVFHASNVESLILHLPVLVVLERSRIVPEKTRVQIKEIFRGLATLPQFKTAAFRNLDVLRTRSSPTTGSSTATTRRSRRAWSRASSS